jgi:hypothetical protein
MEPSSIVQIDPEIDSPFAGCLLVVTEASSSQVKGYVLVPGTNGSEPSPVKHKVALADCVAVGAAEWVIDEIID